MNSETTFTASSGHTCQFEYYTENGQHNVSAVWLGQPPTDADTAEFGRFLEEPADRAGVPHRGFTNMLIGRIEPEDLPRVREIIAERLEENKPHDD